jgi:hypothetical protein
LAIKGSLFAVERFNNTRWRPRAKHTEVAVG